MRRHSAAVVARVFEDPMTRFSRVRSIAVLACWLMRLRMCLCLCDLLSGLMAQCTGAPAAVLAFISSFHGR
jgi:hypothetical protein